MLWKNLDNFWNCHEIVDWDKGPAGHYNYVPDVCSVTLCNARKLEQAKKRWKKRTFDSNQSQSSVGRSDNYSISADPSSRRVRSSLGQIHDKTRCVSCCKLESE